jgi:AmmeMemoRadiSam system protein B
MDPTMTVRRPIYAGSFYAADPAALRKQIEACFTHRLGPQRTPTISDGPRELKGLICPHAGYIYSGPIAAHAYHRLATDGKPDVVVILGPNHTGKGSGLAAYTHGAWRTPLGQVQVNTEIADQILKRAGILDEDESAHLQEHSIEVQLPFLQYLYNGDFSFVPIAFLMQDFESSFEVGQAIADVLTGKNALVIASTDMTHYEPHAVAEVKDLKALKSVENLDEQGFWSAITHNNITACGVGPVVALIAASRLLGARKGINLCYKTSGHITGDYSAVVGYASVALTT